MTKPYLRQGTAADAPSMLALYAPYVEKTPITFECEIPSTAAFTARIRTISQSFPCLVCEDASGLLGYAYASQHNPRAAYQWGVETSIYLDSAHHSRKIGSALYDALLELLAAMGFYTAYALITLPNAKSVGLHESRGFTPVGVLHHTGYKLGAWHDVLYMEKILAPLPATPLPPKTTAGIGGRFPEILARHSRAILPLRAD